MGGKRRDQVNTVALFESFQTDRQCEHSLISLASNTVATPTVKAIFGTWLISLSKNLAWNLHTQARQIREDTHNTVTPPPPPLLSTHIRLNGIHSKSFNPGSRSQ